MRNNRILLFTASRIIYSNKIKKQNNENGAIQVGRYHVFYQDAKGHLLQLTRIELVEGILSADGATLKLDNEKINGKACVFTKNTTEMKSSAQ